MVLSAVIIQLREEGRTRRYEIKVQIDMCSIIYQTAVENNSYLFLVD